MERYLPKCGKAGYLSFRLFVIFNFPYNNRAPLVYSKRGGSEIGSDLAHGAHQRCPGQSPTFLILPSLQWKSSFLFQNPFCIRKGGRSILRIHFIFLPCKSRGSGSLKYCLIFSLKKQGDYLTIPCCRKKTL